MSPDQAVLRSTEAGDLPVADFLAPSEPLVPVTRLDHLFASSPPAPADATVTDGPTTNETPAPVHHEHFYQQAVHHEPQDLEPAPAVPDLDEIYRQGWDAGHEAATAVADAIHARELAMVEAVGRAMASVHNAIEASTAARRHLAVELGLELAELLLGRELELAQNPGRDALVRALNEVPSEGRAVFRFHPDDLAVLTEVDDLLHGRDSELVADPTVAAGDLIIDFDGGSVDATLAAALDRVREALQP